MNLFSAVASLALVALGVSLMPPPAAEPLVLRLEKMRPQIPGVPDGADFRVHSGTERVAFALCDVQRAFPGGEVEHGCRLYDEHLNRWNKSVGWYSAEALQPLTNDVVPIIKTASR